VTSALASGRSRFRFAARSAWSLAAATIVVCAVQPLAHAEEPTNAWDAAHANAAVTICLRSLGPPTAITQEALHRIEAELSASGFLVDQEEPGTTHACAPSDPNIKLSPSTAGIDIAASAGPGDDPVLQTVNARDPATTAELIAIRAVEGLRAAMMQALRRSPDGIETAPESVRRFTRQENDEPDEPEPRDPEPAAATAPSTAPDTATSTTAAGNPKRRGSAPRTDVLLTAGATASWEGADAGLSATLGVAWLLPPLALGIGLDGGIIPGSWNAQAGSVELRPFGITGTVAARLPCGRHWECQLGAGAGMRQFSISAVSTPTGGVTTTAHENHSSVLLMLETLVGYFPVQEWGLFARGQAGFLVDAPVLGLGNETLTWGRPSVGVTLGGAARF